MLSRILHMTNVIRATPGSASMISRPKQPITITFSSSMSLLRSSRAKKKEVLDMGASFSWDKFITLLLVVNLLAREDDVRVGNTVLVGKADIVAPPTDLLCNAGQRVTGLDDIAAVTGGLYA